MGLFEMPDNRYLCEETEAAPTYDDVCAAGFPSAAVEHPGAVIPACMATASLNPDVNARMFGNGYHPAYQPQAAMAPLPVTACVCVRCGYPLHHPHQQHWCDNTIMATLRLPGQMSEWNAQNMQHMDHELQILPEMCRSTGHGACYTTNNDSRVSNVTRSRRLVFLDEDVPTDEHNDVNTSPGEAEFGLLQDKGRRFECAMCASVLETPLQEHRCPVALRGADLFVFDDMPRNGRLRMHMWLDYMLCLHFLKEFRFCIYLCMLCWDFIFILYTSVIDLYVLYILLHI